MKFSGINLLDELKRPELAHLNEVFRERKVRKGAIIFRPDGDENLVFIIGSGRVRIYLGYEAKEFTLGVLDAGDVYSTHGSCFVQALEDSTLLVTDVQSVKRCMADVPMFTRTMVRVLGNILQSSFDVIDGLVFKDSNSRLISYLLNEAASQKDRKETSGKSPDAYSGGMRVNASEPVASANNNVIRPLSSDSTERSSRDSAHNLSDNSAATTLAPDIGASQCKPSAYSPKRQHPAQAHATSHSSSMAPSSGNDAEVALDLTTEQLAQIIGTTRQTVSTLLNNLCREGLLEKRGRSHWYIPNIAALEAQR